MVKSFIKEASPNKVLIFVVLSQILASLSTVLAILSLTYALFFICATATFLLAVKSLNFMNIVKNYIFVTLTIPLFNLLILGTVFCFSLFGKTSPETLLKYINTVSSSTYILTICFATYTFTIFFLAIISKLTANLILKKP